MLSAEASTMREALTTTCYVVWKPVSIVANHCTSSCDLRDSRRLSESSLKNWAAAGRNRLHKLTGNPGAAWPSAAVENPEWLPHGCAVEERPWQTLCGPESPLKSGRKRHLLLLVARPNRCRRSRSRWRWMRCSAWERLANIMSSTQAKAKSRTASMRSIIRWSVWPALWKPKGRRLILNAPKGILTTVFSMLGGWFGNILCEDKFNGKIVRQIVAAKCSIFSGG